MLIVTSLIPVPKGKGKRGALKGPLPLFLNLE